MAANSNATTARHPIPWRAALMMMLNPAAAVNSAAARIPWPVSLVISALAFMVFFLQTGLDLVRIGLRGVGFVVVLSLEGLLFGSLGIGLLATIAWVLTKLFRGNKSLGWALSAFGLAYCSTLIFTSLGLVCALVLHWNTSVAFGVSGVLWASMPMMATIREMSRGNTLLSLVVATVCTSLLLFGWAFLGNA